VVKYDSGVTCEDEAVGQSLLMGQGGKEYQQRLLPLHMDQVWIIVGKGGGVYSSFPLVSFQIKINLVELSLFRLDPQST
jgi:hypothetical protein